MGITTALRDLRTVRALLTGAETEARRDGERTPGPEHLLLAATALPGRPRPAPWGCGSDPVRRRAREPASPRAVRRTGSFSG
jgi:hypothetical protein